MSREDDRYAAVNAQIAQLLDAAANDDGPAGMVGLGSVWLAAEMFARNEKTHMRVLAEQQQAEQGHV